MALFGGFEAVVWTGALSEAFGGAFERKVQNGIGGTRSYTLKLVQVESKLASETFEISGAGDTLSSAGLAFLCSQISIKTVFALRDAKL